MLLHHFDYVLVKVHRVQSLIQNRSVPRVMCQRFTLSACRRKTNHSQHFFSWDLRSVLLGSAEPSEAAAGLCCLAAMTSLMCLWLSCHSLSRGSRWWPLVRYVQCLSGEDVICNMFSLLEKVAACHVIHKTNKQKYSTPIYRKVQQCHFGFVYNILGFAIERVFILVSIGQ